MYNGIGLQTARGSGTNGYVQTNKFFIRPKTTKVVVDSNKGFGPDQGTAGIAKKPNRAILEHDRKRQIELKLTILEDKLIDQGYSDAEIVEKLKETRFALEAADLAASKDGGGNVMVATEKNVSDTQTHQIAARKEKQLETLRAALGIALPEAKAEKQADLDGHENDDEKPKNYKKGTSEGDGEYEEGEILHRHDDREARSGRQIQDLVSEKEFHEKSCRRERYEKGKNDYKHKKKERREKHVEEERRGVYRSSDTESDNMRSTDSGNDSAIDTKRKQRAQRKSNKSMKYSSDSSSQSDDSNGTYGRRGRQRQIHKNKKHAQRGKQSRKERDYSESSDSDSDREKAGETDSDVEIRRKHRFAKLKKSKSKIDDDSDYHSDDTEQVHERRGSDDFVKAHKRHDSDSDSDLKIKSKHRSEKSKKIKSTVNVVSDYHCDDSEREHQRAHKRHDSDLEIRKDEYEKSKMVKSKINDDSDYDTDDLEGDYQRNSGKFVKAPRHDSDCDFDENERFTSHRNQRDYPSIKRRGHDSADDESDEVTKSKGFVQDRVRDEARSDEEHKDDMRSRKNNYDEYRRRQVGHEDRDHKRHRRNDRQNDDSGLVHASRRDDLECKRKHGRVVDDHKYRGDRQDKGEVGVNDLTSGQRGDEKEYKRKHEDDHHCGRHTTDEEHGSKGRGRKEEDHHGSRRYDRDRDSSKRMRYEDSRLSERRHHKHDHYDDDRWR